MESVWFVASHMRHTSRSQERCSLWCSCCRVWGVSNAPSIIGRLRWKHASTQLNRIHSPDVHQHNNGISKRYDTIVSPLSSNDLLILFSQLCCLINDRLTIFINWVDYLSVNGHSFISLILPSSSSISHIVFFFRLSFMWNLSEKGFASKCSVSNTVCAVRVWEISSVPSRHRSHHPQQHDVLTFVFINKKKNYNNNSCPLFIICHHWRWIHKSIRNVYCLLTRLHPRWPHYRTVHSVQMILNFNVRTDITWTTTSTIPIHFGHHMQQWTQNGNEWHLVFHACTRYSAIILLLLIFIISHSVLQTSHANAFFFCCNANSRKEVFW